MKRNNIRDVIITFQGVTLECQIKVLMHHPYLPATRDEPEEKAWTEFSLEKVFVGNDKVEITGILSEDTMADIDAALNEHLNNSTGI